MIVFNFGANFRANFRANFTPPLILDFSFKKETEKI
jgi:hypothetical protein